MSTAHLHLIKASLAKAKWTKIEELPGDDESISEIWRVTKPNGDDEIQLLFEGRSDIGALPIENSYSCHLHNNKKVSLYFGRINKSFKSELEEFIESIKYEFT